MTNPDLRDRTLERVARHARKEAAQIRQLIAELEAVCEGLDQVAVRLDEHLAEEQRL